MKIRFLQMKLWGLPIPILAGPLIVAILIGILHLIAYQLNPDLPELGDLQPPEPSFISDSEDSEDASDAARLPPIEFFQDMTATSGVDFIARNGEEAGHLTFLESLGSGVAVIDFDGDGLLDIFLAGGGHFGGDNDLQILGYPCKLYKNLGNWKFQDVTRKPDSTSSASIRTAAQWPTLIATAGPICWLRATVSWRFIATKATAGAAGSSST